MKLNASQAIAAPEPGAATHSVDAAVFLSRARHLLYELEEAWERGVAEPVLEECSKFLEPGTIGSYRTRIQRGEPPPFRRALLAELLEQFAHDVRPPRHVFPARADIHQRQNPLAPDTSVVSLAGLLVESAEAPRIRVSQAFAARHWGVWYALDSPEWQAQLEASWSRKMMDVFQTNLRAMNRLPNNFQLYDRRRNPEMVGLSFEQLVLDILNEERDAARRAPLDEDLCEKTDLRVSYPTLQRKRGARVQVTFLTNAALHLNKVLRIKHGEEFVVVSPITLARAMVRLTDMPALPPEQKDGLFAALPRSARTHSEVAAALGNHFLQALDHPGSPLGPLLSVAAPIRRFIRTYVEWNAHTSTQQLRRREAENDAP